MYQDNMLEMLSQIEKEDQERRFKHRFHQTSLPAEKRNLFLTYIKRLSQRVRFTDQPVSISPRATSEVPSV